MTSATTSTRTCGRGKDHRSSKSLCPMSLYCARGSTTQGVLSKFAFLIITVTRTPTVAICYHRHHCYHRQHMLHRHPYACSHRHPYAPIVTHVLPLSSCATTVAMCSHRRHVLPPSPMCSHRRPCVWRVRALMEAMAQMRFNGQLRGMRERFGQDTVGFGWIKYA